MLIVVMTKVDGSRLGDAAVKAHVAMLEPKILEAVTPLGSFLGLLISFALDHRSWPEAVNK